LKLKAEEDTKVVRSLTTGNNVGVGAGCGWWFYREMKLGVCGLLTSML